MLPNMLPQRTVLRQKIQTILRTDSDFDAFCGDYFPNVACRFTNGMDRLLKTNLLLDIEQEQAILTALQSYKDNSFDAPERWLDTIPFDHSKKISNLGSDLDSHECASTKQPPLRYNHSISRTFAIDGQQEIIQFNLERSRHEAFHGRSDVLCQIDQWLRRRRGYVLITGSPGIGKSAILHQWLRNEELQGNPWPHHFLRRGQQDWDRPAAVCRNLAAQLEARFPNLRDSQAIVERRLPDLLLRISVCVLEPNNQRLILVIDGLDEAAASPGENPLQLFIPWVLPAGVLVLAASRPTYPNLAWLEGRDGVLRLDLDSAEWANSNKDACSAFWMAQAASFSPPLPVGFIEQVLLRGTGNALYSVKLCEHLRCIPSGSRQVDELPRHIDGILEEFWQRFINDRDWTLLQRGLSLLCVAREALPLSVLDELLGGVAAREILLRAIRSVLLEESAEGGVSGETAFRLYHDSFREYLEKKMGGTAALRRYHRELSIHLASWSLESDEFRHGYALRHGIVQRVEAAEWEDVLRLCMDIGYLEAKILETSLEATLSDLDYAARRSPYPNRLRKEISDISWSIRTETHWLRCSTSALLGLLYNRLVNQGWSVDRLQMLTESSVIPHFVLKHPLQRKDMADRTLVGHAGIVYSCVTSPDGKHIISGSGDQTIKVWDLDSGRELMTLRGHNGIVYCCAVSADGQRAISGSGDHTIKIWDLANGRVLMTLTGHEGIVNCCAVSSDGKYVISGSDDQTLKVWDLEYGCELLTLSGHAASIYTCAISPDSTRAISGSFDQTIKLWDIISGRELRTFYGHEGAIYACAISSDGSRAISGSGDKTLKVWNLDNGRELMTLSGHSDIIASCVFQPSGDLAISGSFDHALKVWDLNNGCEQMTLTGHATSVYTCAISLDGRHIVSGAEDRKLKVWNLMFDEPKPLTGHTRSVRACAVSLDGKRAVSGSRDQMVKVWDLASGREVVTLTGHAGIIYSCAMSPDGKRVVSGSGDQTLKVWDLDTGRESLVLTGHTDSVLSCALDSKSRRVVSGSADLTVKVWDIDKGSVSMTLKGHTDWVTACAISPDNRRIISGSRDRKIRIWEMDGGREVMVLTGHTDWVTSCAVSPNGKYIISGSRDQTLKLWELDSGRELTTLIGHASEVTTCGISSSSQYVISGSFDQTLKVWQLDSGCEVATVYGVGTFLCLAVCDSMLVAGDGAGNIWMLNQWCPASSSRRRNR